MNIAAEFQQVTVFLHQHSLVSPLIKMSNPSMPAIVPSRIRNIEEPIYRVKSLPLIYNVVNLFHRTPQFAIALQALPEPRSLPAHRAVVQISQPLADLLLTDLAIPIHHLHRNRSTIPMG